MFRDRIDAGFQLSTALARYKGQPGIVLAIPRGGIPVGFIVAGELGMPLEILLSKKIGHPAQPEYAIGAITLTDRDIEPHPGVTDAYIEEQTRLIREKLRENQQKFMGDRKPTPLENKILIVVDDGIATGHTLMSTLKMLRKEKPGRIVVAVPVCPVDAAKRISEVADEFVTLLLPESFHGVGGFYEDFSQVSDEEVKKYLRQSRQREQNT